MTRKRFPDISAALAVLRSGGDIGLHSGGGLQGNGGVTVVLRPTADPVLSPGCSFLMTNRLAQSYGFRPEDRNGPEKEDGTGNGIGIGIRSGEKPFRAGATRLPAELETPVLFLLKAAHIVPCLRVLDVKTPDDLQSVALSLTPGDLTEFHQTADTPVFERSVRLPITETETCEAYFFTNAFDSKREHMVLRMGQNPAPTDAGPNQGLHTHLPLVRIHSKCLTGDVFGSLRCDCGEQLKLAKQQIAASGYGALIYLDQEGRGIGLRNKLAAYELQDQGHDTFQANHQLGYESDERRYTAAAAMLRHLGMNRIRLLTNNPDKIEQIAAEIEVVDRVALVAPPKPHRNAYMQAKKASGHLL